MLIYHLTTYHLVNMLSDLYSRTLLTQALMSRDGSRASRLIHERAEMLEIELPSLTTSLLAFVSFPMEEKPQLHILKIKILAYTSLSIIRKTLFNIFYQASQKY